MTDEQIAKEYEPFGPEWVKEVKKCSKDVLISRIRDAYIDRLKSDEKAMRYAEFTLGYIYNGLSNKWT